MSEPTIAQKGPYPVELEAGKSYSWCACGLSANQPFCDGSHRGSAFTPVKFEATETKTAYLAAANIPPINPSATVATRNFKCVLPGSQAVTREACGITRVSLSCSQSRDLHLRRVERMMRKDIKRSPIGTAED